MRGADCRPATLADVAVRAGVSAATVSRVLNGGHPVAATTRERVEQAIQDLEYVVNGHARALAAASSEVVGVLAGDLCDPYFGHVIAGIHDQASASGHLALVCSTGGDPRRELEQLRQLRRLRAGGVILLGGALCDAGHQSQLRDQLAGLIRRGGRVVLCGRPPIAGLPGASAITFDNSGGATRLVEFLTGLGHRRIGYITGPLSLSTARERLHGFRIAARHHDPGLMAEGDLTRESGRLAARQLLRHKGITAIVGANGLMAAGALMAARDLRRSVPGELAVAGFDDVPAGLDTDPPLTTVRLPLREAGALAGRIACGVEDPAAVTRLGAELVVRGTTGRVKG
jgi:LacI family transcriptional regulator